jgi:hypothetical protein
MVKRVRATESGIIQKRAACFEERTLVLGRYSQSVLFEK